MTIHFKKTFKNLTSWRKIYWLSFSMMIKHDMTHNPFLHMTNLQQMALNLYIWIKLLNIISKLYKIVAKGKIAHVGQFLLLPKCFQMLSAEEASKSLLQCAFIWWLHEYTVLLWTWSYEQVLLFGTYIFISSSKHPN